MLMLTWRRCDPELPCHISDQREPFNKLDAIYLFRARAEFRFENGCKFLDNIGEVTHWVVKTTQGMSLQLNSLLFKGGGASQ